MHRAMIIDDDEDYRNLLVRKLCRSFPRLKVYEIDPLKSEMPAEDYPWDSIDFIILDYQLGLDYTGLDWFKRFKPETMPATLLLTARGSEETAVKAIKLGIDDYIVKEQFNNDSLVESINECVYNKKMERAKLLDLNNQSVVFNKSRFIERLRLITTDADTNHHLLLFCPLGYHQIGKEKGIGAQDNYIKHMADRIYRYFSSHHIDCNIYIYKEKYIAVLIQSSRYRKLLNDLYRKLDEEDFASDGRAYTCSVSVGVISPRSFEADEIKKNDFELLYIAKLLSNAAQSGKKMRICHYGDINIKNIVSEEDEESGSTGDDVYNIEEAIADGRVTANYQPWVYISTDETVGVKDIYDVRIEVIDFKGKKISQRQLIRLLEDAYARRVVDRWVLRNIVTRLAELAEKNREVNIKLAAKITLSSIDQPGFIPWLTRLLDYSGVPRGSLMFEIEASQFLRNPESYKELMRETSNSFDLKYVLSGITRIDTYHQVREMQRFDFIKLNVRDLIYGFPRDPLYNLINTIRHDGGKIVAINVADAEMLNLASQFDIDYVHGFLVGKPYVDVISDSEGDLFCVI